MAVSEGLERKNVQCFFQRKKRRQSNASPLFLAPQGPSVLARRGLRRLLDALCQIGHGTRGKKREFFFCFDAEETQRSGERPPSTSTLCLL